MLLEHSLSLTDATALFAGAQTIKHGNVTTTHWCSPCGKNQNGDAITVAKSSRKKKRRESISAIFRQQRHVVFCRNVDAKSVAAIQWNVTDGIDGMNREGATMSERKCEHEWEWIQISYRRIVWCCRCGALKTKATYSRWTYRYPRKRGKK